VELKRQLVRAYLAAVDGILDVDRRARFVTAEPLINVVSGSDDPGETAAAEAHRLSQFEALDMITGRVAPELGGAPGFLDLCGLNIYPHNQWYLNGSTIPMGHHAYRSLRDMFAEASARYDRPIFIAETGAEGNARPYWLYHVCGEIRAAMQLGAPILGACLYPIIDHPGWTNDRHCEVGLLSGQPMQGGRQIFEPLREELHRQKEMFASTRTPIPAAAAS
jgi:hypothetical protein